MAQTNYTPISIYYSATASNVPVNTNLVAGELAINTADGKLFYKDSSGVVQVLATKDATSGSFTNLAYTGTLTGGTGVVNLGSGQFYKDASGNVGIGTTPPSGSTTPSIFLGATTNVFGSNTAVASFGANAYQGSLGWTYASTATAALYSQNTATHAWYTASSGTANTAITWAERMRIDSSGNVGIGTSSPANRLEVNSNARITGSTIAGANFYLNNTQGTSFKSQITWLASGSAKYSIGLDPAGNGTNNFYFYDEVAGSQRMTIDSGGNVLVGVTTASYSSANRGVVNIGGSSGGLLSLISSTNKSYFLQSGADLLLENDTASGSMIFGTNASTERMRIDSSGNLLVGLTSGGESGIIKASAGNGIGVTVTGAGGSALNANYTSTGTGYYGYFKYGGTLVGSISSTGTITVYATTSDYRLKTVIAPVSDSGQRIDALEPIEYDWNNNGGRTRGFLAHKFAEVYPSSVSGEKDAVDKEGKPVYQAMQASSTEVMADLIAEIQSLRKRVAQLESK